MVNAKVQASINLGLNVVFFTLVLTSLFLYYFSFLDYEISLLYLRHKIQYHDVEGIVYTHFVEFNDFACSKSDNTGIRTICSNIEYFMGAGMMYFVLSCIVLGLILFSVLNLLMRIYGKHNIFTDIQAVHYLQVGLYILAGGGYLFFSNIDNLEPPQLQRLYVRPEMGIQ